MAWAEGSKAYEKLLVFVIYFRFFSARSLASRSVVFPVSLHLLDFCRTWTIHTTNLYDLLLLRVLIVHDLVLAPANESLSQRNLGGPRAGSGPSPHRTLRQSNTARQ